MEEDPKEILQSVYECMERTCEKLTQLNIDISNIKGTGRAALERVGEAPRRLTSVGNVAFV